MTHRTWALALRFLLLAAIFTSAAQAQIISVGDDTATPAPGVGHDYIHLLSETVNPANGSVSWRIESRGRSNR
jgi:hypothetical protein